MIAANQPNRSALASEILAGGGLSLAQTARRIPSFRQGRPTNPATIFRWIRDGVRTPDGRRVRLEACRLGGRLLTSEQALARFIAAQQPDAIDQPVASPARRRREHEHAVEELNRTGI